MRIGVDARHLRDYRSGIWRYTYHLLDTLGRIDPANEYVLLYTQGLFRNRTPLVHFRHPNIISAGWHPPQWLLTSATMFRRLNPIPIELLIGRVDLFHAPNFVLLPQRGGKRVITIHDLSFLLFPQFHRRGTIAFMQREVRRSASMADVIIVHSESTKADVMRLLGPLDQKIRVIPLAAGDRFRPIPVAEATPILEGYGLSYGQYLLFVGNLEPRKNIPRLLEAYKLLRLRAHLEHTLVLAYASSWLNGPVARMIDELGLQGQVRLLGYVPESELPYLINGAAILVYPSLYEGFGIPPLEGMACGVPVVTSTSSSIPEVVGEAALCVDPLSHEAIAEAIQAVLSSKALRSDLREKGLQRAKQFSWERTARETLQVYEDVAG